MKRKVAKLRLSPNEEARVLREEHERRRKLRIQQVREQQRHISQHIRREVEQRRQRELERLEKELREDWERQHRERLHTLQSLYQESLVLLGQGHRNAKENEPDLAAKAQKEEENHVKAEERYREALKELKSQRLQDHEKQSRSINARKKALQTEKERSAKVASLPPPLPNPIQSIDSKKPHVVKKSDVSAFAATHYHMPESTVDREADTEQPDAHEGAELEVRRLQDLQKEGERRREEQLEKARLRGKEALRREHLVQDRERLLVELEHMQQTDLLRRRQQVSQMPPQIFQPLYKRQETREDFQREMEFAFEDMYTGERRVKGDLVVQLVPEPLPAPSTGSQDQELDVTLEDIDAQGTGNARCDTEQEKSAQAEPSKPAPRRALKKLLDRIRSQRNQWTDHNSHDPAAESPTAVTDQIPERDTTIDTGSLTSEEKLTPVELPEPARSPPAPEETTERAPAADALRPDVLANRIQEFEEERKKRDEELEREKRQQVVLLQELEEQKATLEQLLLEAQQEREDLKAAVTQRAPVNQPEVPVHDQGVPSVAPGLLTELVPPAEAEDHNRRVKEYQQRLLEQNRIHQRSVEVARQRLEEYQRALRIRYNMTATSLPPVVPPPVLSHPPLHGAPSVHLSAPLQLPTTSTAHACIRSKSQTPVEVPTRESDVLTAPSQLPCSGVNVGSKLLPAESISSSSRIQRPDVNAWLTDKIMERSTEHLTERARPSSEPRPYKLFTAHHSAGIRLQTTSDPVQAVSPSITDGAALVPGHAAVQPAAFPRGSLRTGSLSSREDDKDMERQRRELQEFQRKQGEERQRREMQEVQRRVLEQRETVELQQRKQEEERQRRELQEVQRKQEEERQRREMQEVQRKQEEERQRRELLEVQRRVLEQKEVVALHQEEERQRRELQEVQRRILEQKEVVALHQEEERQRRELQEVQRRVLEQREAMELQQRQQEEERQRQEEHMEHMRRQKETLQALIHADAQPFPEAVSEVLVSENIDQTRLKLLASLLRAIEESNGGTLSHLEDLQEQDGAPSPPPTNGGETGLLPPHRAAKPPVTRVRLGAMEMMTEQHELSVIQEVETPVDTSQVTGPEDGVKVPSHALDWDLQEEGSESSLVSDATLRTPSSSSSGQQTAERSTSSGTGSGRSSHLAWRERLLLGAGTSPESSESDSVLRRISPLSSDSGRGADYSGAAVTSYRSPTESARRPHDSDCLSSTTISTGSYITTDPELNINADKSPLPRHCVEGGADLLDVSSPSAQSSCVEDVSADGRPVMAVQSLFNDSSIQNIIDRYTRELNISLSTAGKTTDSEGSCVEEPDSSGSRQSLVPVPERREEDEDSPARPSLPSDAAGAQRSGLDWDDTVHPVQEQDSFRPLIGQLTDQSSFLAADHRDSAMEQLVGQPSAQSSVIGQLPGPPFSPSLDQGGFDSTLSRMIGRLSHQSGSHWTGDGQDSYAGQLMGQAPSEQSTTWLDESRMKPLVWELDESAGQLSGSSDEKTHVSLGVSTEASVPSYPALPPEASSHSASVPEVNPPPQDQTLQDRTSPTDLGPERTEVFPGSDSFHPLLPEVTHNETTDPSLTFHSPQHSAPSSPDAQPASAERRVSTPSEESEPSPERLRTEEASGCSAASSDSFSRLITSQSHESVLVLSPATMPPEEEDAERKCVSERRGDSVPLGDLRLLSDRILEPAGEKGILEQTDITLVSLTDTTLEERESTIAEEEGQEDQETQASKSTSSLDENQTHSDSVTLLEFQRGPSRDLQEVQQQKLRALQQRSARRVEEIKAKGAVAKIQPGIRAPPEARERPKAKEPQPVTCEAKTESGPQRKTNTKSKGGQAALRHTTEKSGFMKQKTLQSSPPVSVCRVRKEDEVKSCTPDQRKRDVVEMHQRTQRLYEQLEEVKRQKALRNRQEASAENRLKAKEFHKKTLQRLRAKQKPQ